MMGAADGYCDRFRARLGGAGSAKPSGSGISTFSVSPGSIRALSGTGVSLPAPSMRRTIR
jgi:hypothetical protein